MDSADLVRLIQHDARPLVESFYAELRTNLGTSHYHRLSNDELFRRGQAVYHNLANWLCSQDEAAVAAVGGDLGRRRFAEGIPLGQTVLALILHEDHLWNFLSLQSSPADENLKRHVSSFFSALIYSTAHGYEQSLAEKSRQAGRAAVVASNPAAAGQPGDSKVLEVSRGGQIGEQGG